jgi:UDP-N-acetylmuramoyl-L-alanyl-D-glutamate--2,6-diaminopimelate ligase
MAGPLAPFFLKFPEIFADGEQLVWDTRQVVRDPTKIRNYEYPREQSRLARDAAAALESPSQKIRIWAVTGTNGKSSCVEILRHLVHQAGRSVLQLGTLGLSVWRPGRATAVHSEEVGFTTPLAPQLQWIFKRAVEEGIQDVVMEVSSHALVEGRSDAVHFDCAIFTNLTRDHLDFHDTMDNYFDAKARLFRELLARSSKSHKVGVINQGAEYGAEMLQEATGHDFKILNFDQKRDVALGSQSITGMKFLLRGVGEIESSLIGRHNMENLSLCALAAREMLPVPMDKLLKSFASFTGVRGRMERVHGISKTVFVDYAHTPDALQKVLHTLHDLKPAGAKVWVVFGCGGDRDPGKRPLMGQIAEIGADCIVLTSDNPRSEDPQKILADIQQGISPGSPKLRIVDADRRQAIAQALSNLKKNDVCLIAGKGHEDYQIIGADKKHFSDVETVKSLLA